MPDAARRYWAFLSYSHADRSSAEWLHRALEGFVVPRDLVGGQTPAGPAPRRFRPIFKDREELGAAADLSERLRTALADSAYLIVICSPAAARSVWVEQEIRHFKSLRGAERVLAVIVAGEPFASDDPARAALECFPPSLRTRLGADDAFGPHRVEPMAADLRPGGDGRQMVVLKLVAGMLGIDLDQLAHRDARRRRRQLLALTAASVAGSAVLGSLALTALRARDEAVAQRAQAEGLIAFMVGDLRKTLEPAGRLDALDAVGARALSYYAAQQSHGLDAESLGRRATVLHLLGEIRDRRGDLNSALQVFQEASKSTGELLRRRPKDPRRIFDHAQSVFWVGYIAWRRGQDDTARTQFLEYQRLADCLVAMDPNNQAWQAEVGYANSNMGIVLLGDGRAREAAAAFTSALATIDHLARLAPKDRQRQLDLGQSYAWLADAEVLQGRLDEAIADRQTERAIYERLATRGRSDVAVASALVVNRTAVAKILIAKGSLAEAITELESVRDAIDRLVAASPDDTSLKANETPALLLLSESLLQTGNLREAKGAAQEAAALAQTLATKDPTVIDWVGPRLGMARVVSMKIAADMATSADMVANALSPARAEAARLAALSDARPRNLSLARVTAEAQLLAGDSASLAGAPAEAAAYWSAAVAVLERAGGAGLPPTDRSQTILRQLAFRLRFSNPPAGPVWANSSVDSGRLRINARHRVDYRW